MHDNNTASTAVSGSSVVGRQQYKWRHSSSIPRCTFDAVTREPGNGTSTELSYTLPCKYVETPTLVNVSTLLLDEMAAQVYRYLVAVVLHRVHRSVPQTPTTTRRCLATQCDDTFVRMSGCLGVLTVSKGNFSPAAIRRCRSILLSNTAPLTAYCEEGRPAVTCVHK